MLTINTNGNAVEITNNDGAAVNLVNAEYRWYFNNGALRLFAGPMDIFAAVGFVVINGDTPANQVDLDTALGVVFPVSGGGATPSLQQVLNAGNDAGANRIVNMGDPSDDQDAVTKKYYTDNLPNAPARPYKSYVANLQRTGVQAPSVASLKENQLSGAIAWSRNISGHYAGILAGAFPTEGQTFVMLNHPVLKAAWVSQDEINLLDVNDVDQDMNYMPIEIRVYD